MSHALAQRLIDERQATFHQAKALLDAAAAEKRDLTAPEVEQYDRMMADMDAKRARIDQIKSMIDDSAALEASLRELPKVDVERNDFDTKMRSFLKGETRSFEIAPEAMKSATSTRALQKGAATEGGNTVPTSFASRLVEHLVETSGIMQAGPTVLNTSGGETFDVPVTTSHGAAGIVAEEGSIASSSTDPAFAKRSLGAYKYGQIITVAKELVDDTAVDLEGYIARSAGRNVGLALGAHLVTGDGSSKPTGIVTTATAGKTGAAAVAGVFTADNLIDLYYSITSPYRASSSCAWIMRDATIGAVRKLQDGAGAYLFSPAATFGSPDTLMGKPIYADSNVAAVAADAESVVFGDISAYWVRLAGGVRFERSDDFKFDNDQVAFRALIRADGLLVDQTGAVKTFTGGAAS